MEVFYRKTPVLESLFNKVAGLQPGNFNQKNRLQHRCFPVNIANFLRTPFLKSIWERLLLLVLAKFLNELYIFWNILTWWSTKIRPSKWTDSMQLQLFRVFLIELFPNCRVYSRRSFASLFFLWKKALIAQ